ncbi:TadE family protein [Cellulomonas soli]|uniref:TadE family protein n=1 Tax=Cellulomonas soli TaxID=931535 RepID=UPI001C538BFA|nr:TadE family protein [Cellulomonas soli]
MTDDAGSAIVDFALVGGLLTLLFVAVLQLTLAQHVRNTLVDCAAEGARYAAVQGRTADDGVERTRLLVSQSLSAGYADDVTAVRTTRDGLDVIEVRVSAPLPVVGLIGPAGRLSVVGHALVEGP